MKNSPLFKRRRPYISELEVLLPDTTVETNLRSPPRKQELSKSSGCNKNFSILRAETLSSSDTHFFSHTSTLFPLSCSIRASTSARVANLAFRSAPSWKVFLQLCIDYDCFPRFLSQSFVANKESMNFGLNSQVRVKLNFYFVY